MGKKVKLPALFWKKEVWQWPLCKKPRTLSFRGGDDVETPKSDQEFDGESLEMIVRGARSERLFFEPSGDTSSILEEFKTAGFPFKETVVLAIESADPYVHFRRSMEEMVEMHGLQDWYRLEELLGWYLQLNDETNHGVVIGAFTDLLVVPTGCSDSTSSAVSSFPSSPSSPLCST